MIKLTKEQEEAIERLKEDAKYLDLANTVDDDCTICFVEDVEIVLNLIQEQQKETETKQNRIQELEKALIDDNYKYKEEMKKKDKIIDLMAKTLSEVCTGITVVINQFEKRYCEFLNSDEDCCWKTDTDCSYCIKQYFENQAKM